MEKTTEWRPGPPLSTVCRCCLAESCYKDISTEYFWMGKREVYSEMLSETFDISISYSQSGGPNSNSRLICELCISRLRDASDFKKQVQECEKTFMQHLDLSQSVIELEIPPTPVEKEVKLEQVKKEKRHSVDDFNNDAANFPDATDFADAHDDDDDDLDDQPLTKLASKLPKKETVDILELLENNKVTVKRKSSNKLKTSPSKKSKSKEKSKTKVVKASASKTSKEAKPQKKKKGSSNQTENQIIVEPSGNLLKIVKEKKQYQRSARAEARLITKKNASSILECWTVCPFRWKRNRFKCAYCEAQYTDCMLLREHVEACSSQYSIKDIYKKFKEMSLINLDMTSAFCRICSCPFTGVTGMRQHVIEHGFDYDSNHPDGVLPFCLDKDSWRCVICFEKFNNFLKLYEHMNVHYQHYICATCGKGYMTAPRLRKHSEVHITGSFPCIDCGRIFSMRAARDYHRAHAHAKAPRYECPHCNMRFDGYYDRMNHLNEAHREKEVAYSCNHCDLSFKTSGKRAIHVRSVHFPPQRDFRCSYCEWQFKTGYELKRHMVKHTGERNFHCDCCGKSFSRNRALKNHQKTHEELICKCCGVMFKQQCFLIDHLRTNHDNLADLLPTVAENV